MEPVSLTLGAIVAALVAKAFEGAVEGATEGAVDRNVLGRLIARLRKRFSATGDEAAEQALTRVQEVPDSPSRVRALAAVVDERVPHDAELRSELEALVEQARGAGVKISQVASGDQNVLSADLVDSEVKVSYGQASPACPDA